MGRERCNIRFEFLCCSWAGLILYTPVDRFSPLSSGRRVGWVMGVARVVYRYAVGARHRHVHGYTLCRAAGATCRFPIVAASACAMSFGLP